MILKLSELESKSFSVSELHTYTRTPLYTTLSVPHRLLNGLIYIIQGECRYSFQDGEFSLSSGCIAYLPQGSKHILRISNSNFSFIQIDFIITADGESACFSDIPLKLAENISENCITSFLNLEKLNTIPDVSFNKISNFCSILAELTDLQKQDMHKKLIPAINIIHKNPSVKTDCHMLAAACYLSISQFYNLFHSKIGCTPLEYRNKILISQAKQMLATNEISICEVATTLGFDSNAYFCRFFKKQTGLTPSMYIKAVISNI